MSPSKEESHLGPGITNTKFNSKKRKRMRFRGLNKDLNTPVQKEKSILQANEGMEINKDNNPNQMMEGNLHLEQNSESVGGNFFSVAQAIADAMDVNEDSTGNNKLAPLMEHIKITGKGNSKKLKKRNRKNKLAKEVNQNTSNMVEGGIEPDDSALNLDSIEEGKSLFQWLIHPFDIDEFFQNCWEKRPIHLKRQDDPSYYKSVVTCSQIDNALRSMDVYFGKNIDITSYSNGERVTYELSGRAGPGVVWKHYDMGCSIRFLNPHLFFPKIMLLNSTLQEYFGCLVGANIYLTPPNSQGFAPHYDDIEAFVIQIEGKKHWRLYYPREQSEVLPRFSSPNFKQEELSAPALEVTLLPGDMLYFPRGTIHQANTVPGFHSLHVTVSCYQKNTWGDLLEKVLPAALSMCIEEDVEFRKGLPRDYLSYMGLVHSDKQSEKRVQFLSKIKELSEKIIEKLPIDAGVDQMAKQFLHDALPPVLNPDEKQHSVFEDGLKINTDGHLGPSEELQLESRIRLCRANILRLVLESSDTEDVVRIYHYADNSKEYHGEEPQYIEVPSDYGPAVEFLVDKYPEYSSVAELPLDSDEDKIKIGNILWSKGLVLTAATLRKESKNNVTAI